MNNQTNEKDLQKEQKKEKKPWGEVQRMFIVILVEAAIILAMVFSYFFAPQQYANVSNAYNQSGERGTQTTANVGR